MERQGEIEQTLAIAQSAVDKMSSNRVSAYPKAYEVWFRHLNGENPKLSLTINDIIEKYGRISSAQILQLYEDFLAKGADNALSDEINNKITKEASTLEKIAQRSFGLTQTMGDSLAQASEDLELQLDQSSLTKLVKRMAMETADAQRQNAEISHQLKEAHKGLLLLRKNLDEVREESIMDQLTGIGNRRHFDRCLDKAVLDHKHAKQPLSLILADIDNFKLFNDQWGHQTGDQVLRLVALAIKSNVKVTDNPCRYGGEEFAIILPNTSLAQAHSVADRMRMTVSKREVIKRSTGDNLGKITISAGVALMAPDDTPQSMLHRADLCLYAAKNAGRNRVITERDKVMINAA